MKVSPRFAAKASWRETMIDPRRDKKRREFRSDACSKVLITNRKVTATSTVDPTRWPENFETLTLCIGASHLQQQRRQPPANNAIPLFLSLSLSRSLSRRDLIDDHRWQAVSCVPRLHTWQINWYTPSARVTRICASETPCSIRYVHYYSKPMFTAIPWARSGQARECLCLHASRLTLALFSVLDPPRARWTKIQFGDAARPCCWQRANNSNSDIIHCLVMLPAVNYSAFRRRASMCPSIQCTLSNRQFSPPFALRYLLFLSVILFFSLLFFFFFWDFAS